MAPIDSTEGFFFFFLWKPLHAKSCTVPFNSGSGSSLAKTGCSWKTAGGVFVLTSDGAGAKKKTNKKRVNHRASNFLGISGIVAPPAPPAFRNVLGRAARIEKQMHPKPKQTELGVGSEWANTVCWRHLCPLPARCHRNSWIILQSSCGANSPKGVA